MIKKGWLNRPDQANWPLDQTTGYTRLAARLVAKLSTHSQYRIFIWYLMAVCSCNPVIDVFDKERLDSSIFLPLDVLQVICMNNSDDMVEFISPTLPMMVPIQVLGLFQYSNISLLWGNELWSIPSRYYTAPLSRELKAKEKKKIESMTQCHQNSTPVYNSECTIYYLSWIKWDLEISLKANPFLYPVSYISFLLFWGAKCQTVRINKLLICLAQPRDHQCNILLCGLSQISSTKKWVHSSSSHPRKTGSRYNCNMTLCICCVMFWGVSPETTIIAVPCTLKHTSYPKIKFIFDVFMFKKGGRIAYERIFASAAQGLHYFVTYIYIQKIISKH